jgi:hypothetical protein
MRTWSRTLGLLLCTLVACRSDRPASVPAATKVGSRAGAQLQALSSSAAANGDEADAGTSFADAVFTATADGIDLQLSVHQCRYGRLGLEPHIHAVADCDELIGTELESTLPHDGEITRVSCIGLNPSLLFYSRANSDELNWTFGGATDSNLLGLVVALHDPRQQYRPVACGKIEKLDPLPPLTAAAAPRKSVLAVLTGDCVYRALPRASTEPCPDPGPVADCALEHCGLSTCLARCQDMTQCLSDLDDSQLCQDTCLPSDDCANCTSGLGACMLGYCLDTIGCADPISDDGPCKKLEACCASQPPDYASSCLDSLQFAEKLSGDRGCDNLMQIPEFQQELVTPCD